MQMRPGNIQIEQLEEAILDLRNSLSNLENEEMNDKQENLNQLEEAIRKAEELGMKSGRGSELERAIQVRKEILEENEKEQKSDDK